MNPLTREWVEKAQGDYNVALRELRARKSPNYDACCFHAQQCAEKYMKGVLQESGTPFQKIHDLKKLATLFQADPFWTAMAPGLAKVSEYAVDTRYPGPFAGKPEAREAVAICQEVRNRCRHLLGLPALP